MVTAKAKIEPKQSEVRIVFFGIEQKSIFFEKLCEAATKTERHVAYEDTYYLSFDVDGENVMIELVDPGLKHTGAREMGIRKAQGAILYYSAYSAPSYHRLAELIIDFENHKSDEKLPILLIGNEDDYFDEDCYETSSIGHSSTSEGYESETSHTPVRFTQRRPSMEKMRLCNEERIPSEQGKQLALLFGAECNFLSTTISNFTGTKALIEGMIRSIRQHQKHKTNFLSRTRAATFPKEKKKTSLTESTDSKEKRTLSVKEGMLVSKPLKALNKSKKNLSKNDPSVACTIS